MTLKTILACGVALAFAAPIPFSANAAILYDNLAVTITGADGTNAVTGVPNPTLGGLFASFSNLGGARDLTEVDLNMWADNPSDGQTFAVSVWSNMPVNGNAAWPNQELWHMSFSDSTLNATPTVETFDIPNLPLSADTRYWVGLQSLLGTVEFSTASVTDGIGVANEFYINASGLEPNSAGPYLMRVVATPEPSTGALMLAGFAGLGLAGFLRRRRVAA
jgi:hypothetical protein